MNLSTRSERGCYICCSDFICAFHFIPFNWYLSG